MIRTEGLRVTYGRTIALDGISVELEAGVTGLFGPNGSGKSTLLRVLAGLLRPAAGAVFFEGNAIDSWNEDLRRRWAYVGHDSGLYPRLTIAENLTLFARLYGAARSRVHVVLEELQLDSAANSQVGALSAGFKRRAAVARALVHEPDVLLLDEPYANLDDDASALVSDAVKRWRSSGHMAVIATHGAKKLKAYADAGLILKHGRVATSGHYREAAWVKAR